MSVKNNDHKVIKTTAKPEIVLQYLLGWKIAIGQTGCDEMSQLKKYLFLLINPLDKISKWVYYYLNSKTY